MKIHHATTELHGSSPRGSLGSGLALTHRRRGVDHQEVTHWDGPGQRLSRPDDGRSLQVLVLDAEEDRLASAQPDVDLGVVGGVNRAVLVADLVAVDQKPPPGAVWPVRRQGAVDFVAGDGESLERVDPWPRPAAARMRRRDRAPSIETVPLNRCAAADTAARSPSARISSMASR